MSDDVAAELMAAVELICSVGSNRSDPFGEEILNQEAWTALERSGFTLVSVPEQFGGTGGTVRQAVAILRAAARKGVAVPLAETAWLAAWLLAASGAQVPRGPMTAALTDPINVRFTRSEQGWRIDGQLQRVPWATFADLLVVLTRYDAQDMVVKLRPSQVELRAGHNLAGEPRDDVLCRDVLIADENVIPAGPAVTERSFLARATLARVIAMSGAAEEVTRIAVVHASQREQFGKRLVKFQAIQQLLAQLASETAAMVVAAQAASLPLEHGAPDRGAFPIAAAKASASEAAGRVAAWAHQVLGAMGCTAEHPLHRSTRRLWAWREECGNERKHSRDVGLRALAEDAWDLITGYSPTTPADGRGELMYDNIR